MRARMNMCTNTGARLRAQILDVDESQSLDFNEVLPYMPWQPETRFLRVISGSMFYRALDAIIVPQ